MKVCEQEKEIEMCLIYKKESYIISKNELKKNFNELKNEINNLKKEIQILRNGLNEAKEAIEAKENIQTKEAKELRAHNISKTVRMPNNFINNSKNPNNLKFLIDISKDSYSDSDYLDNTFTVFKSINNTLQLIYSTQNKSIMSYNIMNNKKIKEIKNAHNEFITNFKYYLDKINNRDLIISISSNSNDLKLWNINNYECLCHIKNINKSIPFISACLIIYKNIQYIISAGSQIDLIKIFNINGEKINEINNSNEEYNFIDSYYDKKIYKYYIITGNNGYVKSYDINENIIYHEYNDNSKSSHCSIIINDNEEITKLIESCWDWNIRIWNFHTGKLLKKIKTNFKFLNGICLWNNNYLFVGCSDKTIKLIDINKGIILKEFSGHNKNVITVKKIVLPNYGEFLFSQGIHNDVIKFWAITN